MKRSIVIRFFAGALLSAAVVVGCGKDKEEPATVPVPTSEPAAATPDPAPTATEDPDAGAPAASSPGATPQPVATGTNTAPKQGVSIDSCCSALRAVAKSGKSATAKSKAASAAAVCPGIAKMVKDGTVSRTAGLTQIRSALTGFDVPGECR